MSDAAHRFDVELPGGVRLACRSNRSREALARRDSASEPLVVLLHGFPEAAFVWDETLQRLAGRAACVAPNLRGFDGSSRPSQVQDYRARHLVADVAGLIVALGGCADVLVAHDWGGALAWNLAAQQPQRLRRLLILNSPHPAAFLRELRDSPAQQKASAYMNFLCRPDAAALLSQDDHRRLWSFFADAQGQAPRWLDEAMRERYRAAWAQGLDGGLNYYRASPLRPPLSGDDPLHRLAFDDAAVTVNVPTRILWGEGDRALLPGLLDGLERWVPQLRVQRVPEASHWIVHEQPARVAAAIEELLDPQTTT